VAVNLQPPTRLDPVSTRRRFQAPHSEGSRLRARRISQIGVGANEERREDTTNDDRVWIVDVGDGQPRLVRGAAALKELIRDRGLEKTAAVYVLSTTAATLGELAELQDVFEDESDVVQAPAEPEREAHAAEPAVAAVEREVEAPATVLEPLVAAAAAAVAAVAEAAAPVIAEAAEPVVAASTPPTASAADDDFSLLDRPFDDGEYYEDAPRPRWLLPAGAVALVLALGFGGYHLFRPRSVPRTVAEAREPAPAPAAVVAPQVQATPVAPAAPPAVAPAPAPTLAAVPAPTAAPAPAPASAPERAPAVAPPLAVVEPSSPPPAGAEVPPPPARPPSAAYPKLVAAGELQFQAGRTKRAQALFEQALGETPDGTEALIGLAYVHLDKGRVAQATALFARALIQDRNNATALFGLAESHRQGGNRTAALAEFQRFLTLRATGSDSDMARQLVAELSGGGSP